MEQKIQKATKIKDLTQYLGNVGAYELSKMLKNGKKSYKYIVVAQPKQVSGKPETTIFGSDEDGKISSSTPLFSFKNKSVEESLDEIGYKLV